MHTNKASRWLPAFRRRPTVRRDVFEFNRIEDREPMPSNLGFPTKFLHLLRCPEDSGQLDLSQQTLVDHGGIVEGSVSCAVCGRQYRIENGIVRLMKGNVTRENEREIELKDLEYEAMPEAFTPPASGWRSVLLDRLEIPPHLNALAPLNGRMILEIGCGDGRFTMLMAQLGADVLAVDISQEGLRRVVRNYQSGIAPTTYQIAPSRRGAVGSVGLIQADASAFHVAPRSFDRALSATPLDSRDERMKMYHTIADCLKEDGCYVGGVEYDDACRRALGLPLLRRYSPGGILIEHLDIPTMEREIAPYFLSIRMRPIRAVLPILKRLRLPVVLQIVAARICSALPGFRHLGTILLVRAERPVRIPVEGARRRDYLRARSLYRRYKQWRGQEAIWDWDQRV